MPKAAPPFCHCYLLLVSTVTFFHSFLSILSIDIFYRYFLSILSILPATSFRFLICSPSHLEWRCHLNFWLSFLSGLRTDQACLTGLCLVLSFPIAEPAIKASFQLIVANGFFNIIIHPCIQTNTGVLIILYRNNGNNRERPTGVISSFGRPNFLGSE